MDGPDLALLDRFRSAAPDIRLIASGGVGTLDDVSDVAAIGADAVIVGRALYEGRFTLGDAIRRAARD
jgi:phosphoribosylformimino-5-aminoimidazole carboxamide ribotide isomerase